MDAPTIAKLVSFLVTCGHDEWLYLPGVGWLTTKRYKPYVGRDPRTSVPALAADTYLPFFHADPELHRAMNGLQPSDRSFPDEFARYFHALHPDLDDAGADSTLEESFTVVRFPWAEELSDEIHRRLVADGRADVLGFGTFEIVERAGRPGVNPETDEPIQIASRRVARFKTSAQLKERLSHRR